MAAQRKAIVSLIILSSSSLLLYQVVPSKLKLILFVAAGGLMAGAAYLAYRQMPLTQSVLKPKLIFLLTAGSAFLFSFLALYWARH